MLIFNRQQLLVNRLATYQYFSYKINNTPVANSTKSFRTKVQEFNKLITIQKFNKKLNIFCMVDRDRTVSQRSEPISRTALIGEQPNP